MKFLRPSRKTKLARQPVKSFSLFLFHGTELRVSVRQVTSDSAGGIDRGRSETIDRPPRWQIVLLISKDFRRLKKFRG